MEEVCFRYMAIGLELKPLWVRSALSGVHLLTNVLEYQLLTLPIMLWKEIPGWLKLKSFVSSQFSLCLFPISSFLSDHIPGMEGEGVRQQLAEINRKMKHFRAMVPVVVFSSVELMWLIQGFGNIERVMIITLLNYRADVKSPNKYQEKLD
ncbi:OLC1v1017078C1 [Oldenlandia corymbosa var. corymbosa]|uniref:OLC1v1017078C1 n=1 Tax=Oldenlandia corymbosa var. corymbosa TaxID=529605 RepID=A0AAV1E8M2_OLDCO|nr:OLC1v1017078C1 [Oldenlandia corymbosa var. corymbosa]